MTDAELESLAASCSLSDRVPVLRKYLQPCAGFSLGPGKGEMGRSRLGGGPDVPASFEWPENAGRPLDFLLQLDLRELHGMDGFAGWPAQGLLSFFYDLQDQPWGFDPKDRSGHRVFLFERQSDLQSRPAADADTALPPFALSLWPALSVPDFGSRAGERLMRELEVPPGEDLAWESFESFRRQVFLANAPAGSKALHRIGGHPETVQGDMQLEAQLVSHGLYCGDGTAYEDPRREKLEVTCEEWSLLLQLDTDEEAGFMWGDCGMLYYWIREGDRAAADFSRTWMGLQCG